MRLLHCYLQTLAVIILSLVASGLTAQVGSSTIPDVDLKLLGKSGLIGNFRGISVYEGQSQLSSLQLLSSDRGTDDSVVISTDSNLFLDQFHSDGLIKAMCLLSSNVYMAGNFTSIGSTSALTVAVLDSSSGTISALGEGVEGSANTIYCDSDNDLVYIGGSFSKNVAIWNASSSEWIDLPFGGLIGGPVNAIVKFNENLIFGGKFTGLGTSSMNSSTTDSLSTNTDYRQRINLSNGTVTVTSNSAGSYDDPRSVLCTEGLTAKESTWLAAAGEQSTFTVSTSFDFSPTRLRLRNSAVTNYSTSYFRFIALPLDGILNLSYVDPESGITHYCDAFCPLANISTADYQDFDFVNVVGMDGFSLDLLDSDENGVGLSEILLYQEDIVAYAVNTFNEPSNCGLAPYTVSRSSISGNWSRVTYDSVTYLEVTNLTTSAAGDTYVHLYPDIQQSGNYSILLYTPGCLYDSSCSSRGQINITVYAKSNGNEHNTTIYQTNLYEKYDVIYEGYLEANSDSFRPYIAISPMSDQVSGQTIVAERAIFNLTSTTGGLNGLFEYDPKNYTSNSNSTVVEQTVINNAGMDLSDDAEINVLKVANSTLFVGGNFSSDSASHLFAISEDGSVNWMNGGLNGVVNAIAIIDDSLVILGGEFTDLATTSHSDLNYLAGYSNSSWTSLDAGLNGIVEHLVPISVNASGAIYSTLSITGSFSAIAEYNSSPAIEVDGFTLWLEEKKEFLDRASISNMPYMKGRLSSSVELSNGSYILAGELFSFSLESSGAAMLSADYSLSSVPFSFFTNTSTSSSTTKRSLIPTNFTDTTVGAINEISVVTLSDDIYYAAGGQFLVEDGSNLFENFVFLDSQQVVGGITEGTLDSFISILTICNYNNETLVLGGVFEGQVNDDFITSLLFWNMTSREISVVQPPVLGGDAVVVYDAKMRYGKDELVVAGSFDTAGNVSCLSICVFDFTNSTWRAVTRGIMGNVTSLNFIDSDTMIVTGNMTSDDGISVSMASYHFPSMSWDMLGQQSSQLPGTVDSFVCMGSNVSRSIVAGTYPNGTNYLWAYDLANEQWQDWGEDLGSDSQIYSMRLLKLDSISEISKDSLLPPFVTLLVMGSLSLSAYGLVSAAFYNGSEWTPFLYTVSEDDTPGSIYGMYTQINELISWTQAEAAAVHHMKSGFVVLIALAISLAIMFIIIGAGFLIGYYRNKSEGYEPFTSQSSELQIAQNIPASELLSGLDEGNISKKIG
ncbi:cortical protein marker for cell polarity-domain-containing protein [Lipomyces oligophaga]|uniref:cortical protein marker for cell polarity-domain-containing protein n=1 Tax=Lipomyces oligophaga TaxID=45792 RepID=UPI0034CF57D8